MSEAMEIELLIRFLKHAENARAHAQSAPDRRSKEVWLLIAQHWQMLAWLQGARCFCGKLAVAVKYYAGGGWLACCGEHIGQIIAQDTLSRSGLGSPN